MKAFQAIQRTITQCCQSQAAIMAAYVFGSVATGNVRATSDLDVAVLLASEKAAEFSLLDMITQLEQALDMPVDVIVLNTANELLKYQVRKSGKVVFDRDPRFRKQFEILSRKMYEDFLYMHRQYVQNVLYA